MECLALVSIYTQVTAEGLGPAGNLGSRGELANLASQGSEARKVYRMNVQLRMGEPAGDVRRGGFQEWHLTNNISKKQAK